MTITTQRAARIVPIAATAAVLLVGTTACAPASDGADGASEFSVLAQAENTDLQANLTTLSQDQCAVENEALPLKIETVPGLDGDQRLQLLASQDALPVLWATGNPATTKDLADAGQVLDLEATFNDLGISDLVTPAAKSTVETINGAFNVLPFEYNIEGFWYNKEIFDDAGVEVPTTWEELAEVAAALSADGVQPFSASGEQGWPLTRLISGFLFRELGPEAMQRIASGDAQLTDPEYVEGAAAVAELGAAGYFGNAVGSIDYDTSINQFISGQAAILYMGSWVLANFKDETLNTVGNESIGFFPVPEVDGGEGSITQTPANVGVPYGVSSRLYNDEVGARLTCIAENYGDVALAGGATSGFALGDGAELDELTQLVQDQIADTDQAVTWFEALMSAKASSLSAANAAPLVTGSITPEDFMSTVQAGIEPTS